MKNGESSLKKVDFTIVSTSVCKHCKRPLKVNVIKRNPNATMCYVCFKLSTGHIHFYEHGEKKSYIDLHHDNCKKFGGKPIF